MESIITYDCLQANKIIKRIDMYLDIVNLFFFILNISNQKKIYNCMFLIVYVYYFSTFFSRFSWFLNLNFNFSAILIKS